MLFGGIFDLISRIIFEAKSDQNRIDGLKLDNVFNELFAKSLYLLPQSKWRKVVRTTGLEPVTLRLGISRSILMSYAPTYQTFYKPIID